jgi:hypothetical protein
MNRSTLKALFALVLGVLFVCPSQGQVVGSSLSGTVTDASGSPIAAATVSIKNKGTAVVRQVVTDSAGFYSAPNLSPGVYDVTFSSQGFSTEVHTAITLTVGATQALNATLKVGKVTEEVRVTDLPPQVQMDSSTLSAEVNSTTVRELPLNGRDWTILATLQPGVTAARTEAPTNASANRGSRGWGAMLVISGHRPSENNYRMNGVNINDYTNSAPGSVAGVNLGVDAIQEFSVLTANYSAEYGRGSGGVINAIMKSGTNLFHGDLFWFLRDQIFDARNFFDPPQKNPFHRNQFGASAGGPIQKDKTFVFGAYEGLRQDKTSPFKDTVLSEDARNGTLHNADGTTTQINVDPLVVPYLQAWPLPNQGLIGTGNTGFYLTSGKVTIQDDYTTIKVDHRFSEKDSLSGSYFYDTATLVTPDALNLSTNAELTGRQMASLEETHVFNSTLVNTVHGGWSRSGTHLGDPVAAINPAAKDPALGILPGGYLPTISVPGLTTVQGGFGSQPDDVLVQNSTQVYDDAFLTQGTQSLKFGFAFERLQFNELARTFQNGNYSFPSLQGFLTNTPTSLQLTLPLNLGPSQEEGLRQSLFGGYFQDDWHVRHNLTLNLGLRYEMVTVPTDALNRAMLVQNFYGGTAVHVNQLFESNPTVKNFEPRVGFAWDPFGHGKTAVRGGFGIFDALPLLYTIGPVAAAAYPFETRGVLSVLPPGSFPTEAVSLIHFDPNNLSTTRVKYNDPNPKRSYVMAWNLNVQQELGWDTTMTLGYVGSVGRHQVIGTSDSDGVLGQATPVGYLWPFPVGSGTRLNPNVGNLASNFWDGSASYNALQLGVVKRLSHGIQIQGSYTWGRCIDDGSEPNLGDALQNGISSLLFYDHAARHGNCDFDIRNVFVANGLWALPTPTFGNNFVKQALGGWELGSVVTVSSGTPFTVLIAGDPLGLHGSPFPLPDRLTGSGCKNVVNPGNVNAYIKLSCFTPPVAPASFASVCQPAAASVATVIPNTCMNLMGDAGRNQIFGPGIVNVDFSVFRNIPVRRISETFNVQLRFEFFNLFNRPDFQSPIDHDTLFNQNGTGVSGAGTIDATTLDSREIQFGLKVIW